MTHPCSHPSRSARPTRTLPRAVFAFIAASYGCEGIYDEHPPVVRAVAHLPGDVQLLAATNREISVMLAADGTLERQLAREQHGNLVPSPDGALLAVATDEQVTFVRTDDGSRARTLPIAGSQAGRFSRDGRLFAAGHPLAVSVWDVQSGARVMELRTSWNWEDRTSREPAHLVREVGSIDFGPDGRLLAGGDGLGVTVWHLDTGQIVWNSRHSGVIQATGQRTSRTLVSPVRVLRFSPAGETLASGGAELRLFAVDDGRELWRGRPDHFVRHAEWALDGRLLASDGVGTVELVSATDGHVTSSLTDASARTPLEKDSGLSYEWSVIESLSVSRDGRSIVAARQSGRVSAWRVDDAGTHGLSWSRFLSAR